MLGKLLGGDIVKNVGSIIDNLHTSEEEKNNALVQRLLDLGEKDSIDSAIFNRCKHNFQ